MRFVPCVVSCIVGVGIAVFFVLPMCWIRIRFFFVSCGICTILFACLIGNLDGFP